MHEKTKAELESEFGLAGWNGGPNTEEAKIRVLNCYLNQTPILYLKNLQLTSLPPLPPFLIQLFCEENRLSILPDLPNSLTVLHCSCNHLTILPTLPIGLLHLDCSFNNITSLPSLSPGLIKLDCSHNEITSLSDLPDSLVSLNCSYTQITSLSDLPNSLINLDCSNCQLRSLSDFKNQLKMIWCFNNYLESLLHLPNSLMYLLCSYNKLRSLPIVPAGCQIISDGNPLEIAPAPYPAVSREASTVKFQIPKGEGSEPLWCRVLMNEVKERYQGEESNLVAGDYKIWGDDTLSIITIKKIDGDEALIFTFDESSGILASVKDQSGVDVSLMTLKK